MREQFAKKLRMLRKQRYISAREMSLALGRNDKYIHRIENCESLPSMTSFFKICDYLHVTPKEFFDGITMDEIA